MNMKVREEVSGEDRCYVASKNAHGAVIAASYSIIRSLSFFPVLALLLFFLQNVPFRHSPSCLASIHLPNKILEIPNLLRTEAFLSCGGRCAAQTQAFPAISHIGMRETDEGKNL